MTYLPLFAGKYLFLAEKYQHDVRLTGTHPNDTIHTPPPGYDANTGLVTIEDARTDIDFIDYTAYELSVFAVDSGENVITHYPDSYSNAGEPIKVTVSGENGQASDVEVDEEGKIVVKLNPGEYTVTIPGAVTEDGDEYEDVDLTSGERSISLTIPVKIELAISPKPKLFDVPDEFLEEFGLNPEDNPE